MRKLKNIINQVFGRLTVILLTKKRSRGSVVWKCWCECGNQIFAASSNLVRGDTKSCGCIRKELLKSGFIRRTHGFRRHPLYWVWSSMKSRCNNPKVVNFRNYGGRGITVCKRWLKFENFRDDMYKAYLEHVDKFGRKQTSIDRIDNNRNYEARNCRWVTQKEQQNNRRNNH